MKILVGIFLLVSGAGAHAWTLTSSAAQGWANHDMVIHWNFATCGVAQEEMLTRLDQAIAAWNGASGVDLRLSRPATESAETAANFIAGTATDIPLVVCDVNFATNNSVDANYIPAATRLSMASGPIDYGAVLINADAVGAAAVSRISSNQLAVILAHELGHLFGLGHSSVPNALMYYSVTDKTLPIITEDDLDGMSFLYPHSELSGGLYGCGFVSSQAAHFSGHGAREIFWSLFFVFAMVISAIAIGRKTALAFTQTGTAQT